MPGKTIADATTLDELVHATDFRAEHADVLRLYWAFFVRDPDVGGAKYWIGFYNNGVTLDVIAVNFAGSVEFVNRYGAPSNADYINAIYGNILGREPDAEGYLYWLDLLDTGALDHGGVVRWMAANTEFINAHPYP